MATYSPITVARFWSKVDVRPSQEDCWLWRAGTRRGYGFMKVDGSCVTASRMAWELASGEKLGNRMALHSCDNRLCCNPHHISAGDHARNMQEAKDRGRLRGCSSPGERNPSAKLKLRDVRQIRKMIARGDTNKAIAARYPVTHSMVSRIRRGRSWADESGRNQERTRGFGNNCGNKPVLTATQPPGFALKPLIHKMSAGEGTRTPTPCGGRT